MEKSRPVIDLHLRPEFTYELVQAIPYAKWLHDCGNLGTVYTSKGMAPYYFFAENVEEVYNERTVDNKLSGVLDLPNTWLHHNAVALTGKDYSELTEEQRVDVNGVLDYLKWSPPDYRSQWQSQADAEFDFKRPVIIINNQFNIEKNRYPTRYFSIECLYELFNILTTAGYTVIYNRPNNTEFVIDENEKNTINAGLKLEADVEGIGVISDYDLCEYYDHVILFRDMYNEFEDDYTYNEFQLMLYCVADGFIGLVGGAGTLSCYYKRPTVMYATVSRAIADGYWKPTSYYQILSDQNAYPIIDKRTDQIARGGHDYSELYSTVKKTILVV
jgi:hypothetical protein